MFGWDVWIKRLFSLFGSRACRSTKILTAGISASTPSFLDGRSQVMQAIFQVVLLAIWPLSLAVAELRPLSRSTPDSYRQRSMIEAGQMQLKAVGHDQDHRSHLQDDSFSSCVCWISHTLFLRLQHGLFPR